MCKIEAIIGYNLTDANSMMNQYDSDVKCSSLKKLINYVCGFSIVSGLKKVSSSLKTPLPPDPTKYVHMHDNIMLFI